MPKKYPRTHFTCDRCGNDGDLSYKYFLARRKVGLPLHCAPCRAWQNHNRAHGCSGSVTEGARSVRRAERVKVNGCVLVATDYGRCSAYFDCPDAEVCLNITAKRNWSGFDRMEGGTKCK
jgi:hypothetical protein